VESLFLEPSVFRTSDNSLKLSLAFSGPAFSFSWEEAVMHAFNTRPSSSPKGLLQSDVGGAENSTEVQAQQKKRNKKVKSYKGKNYRN